MVIATLIQLARDMRAGIASSASKRRSRKARREMEALPHGLLRDIGWPPEHHGGSAPGRIHHKYRSVTS